jgi:hypothetical protein
LLIGNLIRAGAYYSIPLIVFGTLVQRHPEYLFIRRPKHCHVYAGNQLLMLVSTSRRVPDFELASVLHTPSYNHRQSQDFCMTAKEQLFLFSNAGII